MRPRDIGRGRPVPGRNLVEVGHGSFFKSLMPERTSFVAVGGGEPAEADLVVERDGPAAFRNLLAQSKPRAILCRINHHPTPAWDLVSRMLRTHLSGGPSWRRLARLGASVAARSAPSRDGTPDHAGVRRVPLVVYDFEDEDFVHASHLPLLRAADAVFKRELPVDRWRLLRPQPSRAVEEGRWRAAPDDERFLARIRPLTLGLPLTFDPALVPVAGTVAKEHDIFFVGQVQRNSWVRRTGLAELDRLKDAGIGVHAPANRLEQADFFRACAGAWLTWSPEGYGWDCFRHYEAAACGSVPLINYPTIERQDGLADRAHAWFYDPAPGGLAAAVSAALADRDRLAAMAASARAHVERHCTATAMAARMLASVGLAIGQAQ